MTSQPTRKILLAMDESDHSISEFEWFMKHFFRDRDRMFLFYSATPIITSTIKPPGHVTVSDDSSSSTSKILMKGRLDILFAENRLKGQVIVVESSSPGEAIVHAVNERKIDIVVIGSIGAGAGSGADRRKTVGRVCSYVMEHVYIPTLVYKM